jgi:ferredoxin
METTLFYFSATGNSLSLVRCIANELGDCQIVSIAKAIKEETIEVKTSKVGIIFPVYAWGMPRIVTDFIEKIEISKESYVFAVSTCVAIPGNTMKDLQLALKHKGIQLHAGYATKAGRSSLMKLNSLDKTIMRLDTRRTKIKTSEERLHEIVNNVKSMAKKSPETSNWTANVFGSFFHNMGLNAFKTMDSQFTINADCNHCGTCAKVCPRNNIELLDKKPTFKHNCELCHACIQWCPNFAIRHANFDAEPKQYRNAAIQLKDMVTSYE